MKSTLCGCRQALEVADVNPIFFTSVAGTGTSALRVHSHVYQLFVSFTSLSFEFLLCLLFERTLYLQELLYPFPRNHKPERLLMGFPGSKFLVYTTAAIHFHRWKKEGA